MILIGAFFCGEKDPVRVYLISRKNLNIEVIKI
jgi:hypothetical protein